jgi:transposase-like protein
MIGRPARRLRLNTGKTQATQIEPLDIDIDHLRRYNGIPRHHFHLYLKECEWRFNYRPTANLLKTLTNWVKI